ncbi:MAG TPA: hypothetical protein VGW74_10605 [Propionibacteriaceae bacterium]|nr:hypothetical protein [Propionibacteriaceae bacterium]
MSVTPIPNDQRGDFDPGDCPTCNTRARVVTWLQANPFEDTWTPDSAACVNDQCEANGQPVEIQVPA